MAELDGYIGYYEPYATSHEALDRDQAFWADLRNAARTLGEAVIAQRRGRLANPGGTLVEARPK
jgi:hypothetical protein